MAQEGEVMGMMQRRKRLSKEFRGQARAKAIPAEWRNFERSCRAFAEAVASLSPENLEAIRRARA